MRERSCSHRPLSELPFDPLAQVVRLVDRSREHGAEHLAFHAAVDGEGVDLGLLPIPGGVHPFSELAGLVAPPEWTVFGLQVQGTSHHLDDGRREPSTTTFAVDREGGELTIMRVDGHCHELRDAAEGTLPDLCRRVLELPTPPPPAPTGMAFTLAWLDRVLDAWNDLDRRRNLCGSFAEVASLHPAVAGGSVSATTHDLTRRALDHAAAWPWSRLRAEPEGLALPDGSLPTEVTTWMDDGAYARWVLGAFPDLVSLAVDTVALLGPFTGEEVAAHLHAVLAAA